jgi:hypothetical protein
METSARWVWHGEAERERNVFVFFRRVVRLDARPEEATLYLFADSRYRLFVNGTRVEYGPARFARAAPEYDSIDLSSYLKRGTNVLTVEVNHYGVDTAEADPSDGPGFIAWGSISSSGAIFDLSTPGDWTARRPSAWDQYAPNWSFMNHATEICDRRNIDPSWYTEPGAPGWEPVSTVEAGDRWGPLRPRSVPRLRRRRIAPLRLCGAYVLAPARRRGPAFRLHFPEIRRTASAPIHHTIAWYTWLHAAGGGRVELKNLSGDVWMNGEPLALLPEESANDHRTRRGVASLRPGANLLFVVGRVRSEAWDFTVALPEAERVIYRVGPRRDSEGGIAHTGAIESGRFEEEFQSAPGDAEELAEFPFEFAVHTPQADQAFPSRDCAWDRVVTEVELGPRPTFPMSFRLESSAAARAYVFDMGAPYLGHVTVDVDAPGGTIVDVCYEEQRRPDGLLPVYRHAMTDYTDRFILRSGAARLETFHVRGGRYIQITVRPPECASGKVLLQQPAVVDDRLPLEIEGGFECSDSVFNETWEMCRRTFEVCTTDTYIPDVARERGLAIADNRLQTHIQRVFTRDLRASKRSISMFLSKLREDGQLNSYAPSLEFVPFVEFTPMWVMWVYDHWTFTGDTELVEEAMPVVRGIFGGSAWKSNADGLWTAEGLRPFVDWGATAATTGGAGNMALNAVRYRALRCAEQLASAVGDGAGADRFGNEADELSRALRRALWRSESGIFAPSLDSEAAELHPNVLALAFDLAPEDGRNRLVSFVKSALRNNLTDAVERCGKRAGFLNLYYLYYALQGLYRVGEVAFAEELIRAHWGFLIDRGALTTWESILQATPQSHCHVWGAHPVVYFVREVLGVKPQLPGDGSSVVVEPRAVNVSWARGRYPLSAGTLEVFWEVAGDTLRVTTAAPEGFRVTARPRGRLGELRLVHDHRLRPAVGV